MQLAVFQLAQLKLVRGPLRKDSVNLGNRARKVPMARAPAENLPIFRRDSDARVRFSGTKRVLQFLESFRNTR